MNTTTTAIATLRRVANILRLSPAWMGHADECDRDATALEAVQVERPDIAAALTALDDLDDFARMAGIEAHGAVKLLTNFVNARAVQVDPVAGINPVHCTDEHHCVACYSGQGRCENLPTWDSMDSAPKDGTVFVIRFPLQGNVKKLCYWNTLHKLWESHGEAIFPESQKCEWSLILLD